MKKKILSFLTAIILALSVCVAGDFGTVDSHAVSNTIKVIVKGTRYATESRKLLTRINEIRKEAYDLGYVDKYVPAKWSYDMEQIAELRAVEATVYMGHTRPNGESTFTTKSSDGNQSWGENLAWNQSASAGLEAWYEEKSIYAKHKGDTNYYSQYGHYENLIAEGHTYVGLSAFKTDGLVCLAAEFTSSDNKTSYTSTKSGSQSVTIETQKSGNMVLSDVKLSNTSLSLTKGQTKTISAKGTLTGYGLWTIKTAVNPVATWSSSDKTVATVSSSGKITAKSIGTAVITAKTSTGSYKCTVTVKAPVSLSKCKFSLSIKKTAYTGKAKKPTVKVTYGSKVLTSGTDCTVTYSNNTNVGKATVTIKGKGKYTGTKKLTFNIIPRKQTVTLKAKKGGFTVNYQKRSSKEATHYQIKYSTKKTMANAKVAKVTDRAINTKTINTKVSNKTYYVRVRTAKKIGSTIYYGAWSTIQSVKTK
ncbi:MAG: CAP domain-containing protein [Clostridium sp.]|nr:CAP domain-containing protein [Clostridium sp.]MCM1398507.1 CAP domain-containing protein [Clostridium sp.]MCM1460229.1 CAP domain-containing protein [Bacteroides sp.]